MGYFVAGIALAVVMVGFAYLAQHLITLRKQG
jgi:hypothetical protein